MQTAASLRTVPPPPADAAVLADLHPPAHQPHAHPPARPYPDYMGGRQNVTALKEFGTLREVTEQPIGLTLTLNRILTLTLSLIFHHPHLTSPSPRPHLNTPAEGGYKDTPPFVLPTPPTFLQRLPTMLLGEGLMEVRTVCILSTFTLISTFYFHPFLLPCLHPPHDLNHHYVRISTIIHMKDVAHITALRKNAAALLYIVGLLSGLAIAVGGTMLLGTNAGGGGGGVTFTAPNKKTTGAIASGKTSTRTSPRKTSRTRKDA